MEVACLVAPAEDWVVRTADRVRAEAERRHPGLAPTCASGISPSGPVHLGNLRELMVPHLVADEVRKQGAPCRHILSWDDYDRLRRVPAGFPDSFAEYIGRPLSAVPDPCGRHPSWAEHFKEPLREALAGLGIVVTEISQTKMYTSGAYTEQIVTAMRRRADIGAVLARYQTKRGAEPDDDDPQTAVYYPFRPYCAVCGRDDTTVIAFDDETTEITYICACGARVGPTPIARGRREAGLEGRLADALGLRARDVRAGRGRPLLARVQLHRRRAPGVGDLRRPDAAALRVRLRRLHRRLVEDQ